MPVGAAQQLTIDFQPGLTERFDGLLDCIKGCAHTFERPMKSIAMEMDMSPSELSRRLASNPGDPRNFSVTDLEKFIQVTGDVRPIHYLVEKYLQDAEVKQKMAIAELAKMAPRLKELLNLAEGLGSK